MIQSRRKLDESSTEKIIFLFFTLHLQIRIIVTKIHLLVL